MSRRSIFLVVFLAVISLIGVISIQIFWVNKAFNIQEREFNDRTVVALTAAVQKLQRLNQDSSEVAEPVTQESSNYFVANVNDTLHPYLLEATLKAEFENSNLKQDFEYIIYNCFNDSIVFGDKVIFEEEITTPENSAVTPQKKLDRDGHYFGVYFPEKRGYILDQMSIWIFSSFIILLVVAFFSFAILAILKQKRLSEIKTDFINNMTHELKTPISTITLSSEAILNQTNEKKTTQYASIIQKENRKLKQQVERVLDIATLSPSKIRLTIKPVDLHETLKELKESFLLKLENQEGEISLQLNANEHIIQADNLHLANVFNNLLDNGLKYCETKPKIQIHTKNRGDKIIVSVRDNGIGIDKKHHKMIFERFFRVPKGNIHDVKGFGLGLFYVKSVLEEMDGKITLNKSTQSGSEFLVTLRTSKL